MCSADGYHLGIVFKKCITMLLYRQQKCIDSKAVIFAFI